MLRISYFRTLPTTVITIVAALAGLVLAAGTAYAAAGSLDRTFSKDGRVTTQLGGYDNALDIVSQADGKIVAAGYSGNNGSGRNTALVRYNRNGALDKTFGGGDGKVVPDFSGSARAVVVQPDGKIIAAGGSRGFALARYNPDGSPDTTFGDNGTTMTDNSTGYNDSASDLVVQPDGKILVAGQLFDNDFALARFNSDGSLDPTFSGDGVETTDFGGGPGDYAGVTALALQSDGRIVAAGQRGGNDESSVLARYSPEGALDTTFGEDGKVITGSDGQGLAVSLVVQPDGKPVVAGGLGGDFALERYNTDGTLDPEFGGDGVVTTNFRGNNDKANALVLQLDGKLVAAGYSGSSDFALASYNPDGTLNKSFGGGDGKATTDFGGNNDKANALALQPDGRLVAAGGTFFTAQDSNFALARYTTE